MLLDFKRRILVNGSITVPCYQYWSKYNLQLKGRKLLSMDSGKDFHVITWLNANASLLS